jgi:AraC-like DNA-binding protein
MKYFSYHPAFPLGELVDYFWLIVDGDTPRKERILPSGTTELVINLVDDEVRIHDPLQPERYKQHSGAVVSGTYSHVFVCDAMQHQSMMGAHFLPGGAFPFFGAPANELTDSHTDLEDLWGRMALDLREQLCAARTPHERLQLMERDLIDRLRRAPKRHRATEAALHLFGPEGRGASTRDVAREVGLSQRRLIQLFSAQVGLTPKLLCRVLRFQRVRTMAQKGAAIDWAGTAAACGYYDQSHLINDFREFSGMSPEQYLRMLRPARLIKDNHLPLPGEVNSFQDGEPRRVRQ